MATYGEVYRQMRVNKNMTLQNVERATGINNSVISRFERNITAIGLDKLDPLLAAIHVSQSEFLFEYHYALAAEHTKDSAEIGPYIHKLNDPFRTVFADLLKNKSYSEKNYQELLPIIEKRTAAFHANPNQFDLLVLSYYRALYSFFKDSVTEKRVAQPDSNRDAVIIKRYLLNVDSWGVFEILLFLISETFFTPQENLHMLQIGYRKSERLSISDEFRSVQFQLLGSDFTTLLAQKALPEAAQVLQMMQQQKGSRDLAEKVVTLFYEGWLAIAQGDTGHGEKICRSAIAIFHVLHDQASENNWTQYLNQILNDPSSHLILLGWTL